MTDVEKFIRTYLRNKDSYDSYVAKNMKSINREISRIREFKSDISINDAVLPSREKAFITPGNTINDPVYSSYVYWEKLREDLHEEQNMIIKGYIRSLEYYTSLKIIYDSISCMIYKLNPKEREVIDLYMKGYKYDSIANDLKCCKSKTTLLIKRAISRIKDGVDEEKIMELMCIIS